MNITQACPSPGVLKAMLDGRASEDELEDLGRHLDGCEGCRAQFDDLARGERASTAGVARIASAMQSPPLRRALERLERVAPLADETAPSPSGSELPSYLQPADDPNLLGKLGPYEIMERIGSGGMAVVFKGRDPRLNRIVAIKVMAPHLAANGTARQRFFREALAAAAVADDHVVTIHAVEEANGLPILVMQYVPGVSLREKIDRDGPLDLKRVLRIALQAASGLAAAHAQGLIHRDIKPENILLENGIERVRITDFGLATAADDVALTQTGFLAGTPQYMSPEQAQGRPIDGRSDLFSLGSVIYEMCTGRAAFRASNPYAAIHRVCNEEPRPIRQISPDVPPWMCEIVDRLIDKDKAQRYQSARDLIEELQARLIALQNPHYEETAAAQPVRPAASRNRPAQRGRRSATQQSGSDIIVAPAVLLMVVSVLVFLSGLVLFAAVALGRAGLILLVGGALSWFIGAAIFVCSLFMLRRSSYPAAICGAALAMLPITPVFPLTFLAGLFALVVLLRDDVKAAFASQSGLSSTTASGPEPDTAKDGQARSSLLGPALGLQGAAGLAIFFAEIGALFIIFPLIINILEGDSGSTRPPLWVLGFGGLFGILPGGVALLQIVAASRAIKTDSVVAARVAAMCAALPLSPAWLLGLPMAIWMWVAIHRRWAIERVERALSKRPPLPGQRPQSAPLIGCVASAVVALFVVVVVAVGFKVTVWGYQAREISPTRVLIFETSPAPHAPLGTFPEAPTAGEDYGYSTY